MTSRTPEPQISPSAASAPRPGDRIGTYRLVRLIGEGATGRVFEVEHLTIGRRAAMKILAPDHADRPGAIKRLFSEARAVNQISHPGIVEVTDLVEAGEPGGVNAIVMELLEGESLASSISRERRLAPERFVPILSQVADALGAAHAARFIHRDLKPENIYLTVRGAQQDSVKLLDFGLAKSIADEIGAGVPATVGGSRRSHTTAEGTFVGTPAYASPEQASGKPVDHRTDIYALGVILYELLCGKLPFEGRNFGEYLVKHLTEPVPPPPADVTRTPLGRTLYAIAHRCLAKNPEGRWSSAGELKRIFDGLARGETIEIPGGVPDERRSPVGRRLVLGAGLAIAAVLTATLLGGGPRQSPPRPVPAAAARRPEVVPLLPPKSVIVYFVSDPPGAQTREVGRGELLGITPFPRTFPADGARKQFEMRRPGYQPRRDPVVLAGSADITVGGKLKRSRVRDPAPPPPEPAAQRRKVGRNTTLNPFSP